MASIFDNVQLENCFILEGEQADAYKAKKEADKAAEKSTEDERNKRRYSNDDTGKKNKMNPKQKEDRAKMTTDDNAAKRYMDRISKAGDSARKDKAYEKASREYYNHPDNGRGNIRASADAINRHMRRHPEKKVSEALDMLASIEYPYNG